MNNKLTFKEFMHLTTAEKDRRFSELSNHDKLLARMNDWGGREPDGTEPDEWNPTEEELDELLRIGRGEAE